MECTKTILWVEDFDDKDTELPPDDLDAITETASGDCVSDKDIDNIQNVFKEESNRVDLRNTVTGAIKAIDDHCYEYDCVVLDVNMTKGGLDTTDDIEYVEKALNKAGVVLPNNDKGSLNKQVFEENTGYYLYLYLVCQGFPKDRIMMRTAYKEDKTKSWDTNFKEAGLKPPIAFAKEGEEKEYFHQKLQDICECEEGYYRIRRLVFDATNHWLSHCEKPETDVDKFLFNDAVVEEGKHLKKSTLCELLNEIKSLFPIRHLKTPAGSYSSALRKLSWPFEASVNYSKLNRNERLYLTIMRILRNWYAHNIISKQEMSQQEPSGPEFLFLLIIALRALFDKLSSSEIYDYEKSILEYVRTSEKTEKVDVIHSDDAKGIVYRFFRETFGRLEGQYRTFSTQYNRLIEALGKCNADCCTYERFIELMWASKYPITMTFIDLDTINSNRYRDKLNSSRYRDKQSPGIPVYLNFEDNQQNKPDILDMILRVDYALRKKR